MAVKLDRWEGAEERSRDEVFAELYESSYPSLVKYCRGLLNGGSGDPEEIAQEAFLRAWMTWERYSTSRPFWALVATIARNLCMDHHRHERVVDLTLQQRAGELSSLPTATPEERLEQDEELRWASEALSELCPNHQRLLRLREVDGLSCDAIAASEGTTVEATTAALYRARLRLRDAYNRVAAGAMAGMAVFPFRGARRRFGWWAHLSSQAAATSPGLAARAGDAVATVVAIAVVSGAPVVNPVPQTSPVDQPAGVVAPYNARESSTAGAGGMLGAPQASPSGSTTAKPAGSAAKVAAAAAGTATGATTPIDVRQARLTDVTPAPSAGKSRDVYASGTSDTGCVSAPCPVLFRSVDGGGTWQQLEGDGFSGGTVLLAPDYPVDKRIFVGGPGALQVSNDGGATFSTLAPLGGPAAISPGFSGSDPRIVLGAVPGWEYRADSNTTAPLHLDPRPAGQVLTFAFSPGYPMDARMLVGGATPTPGKDKLQSSTVTVCSRSQCASPTVLPGADGVPDVFTARSFVGTGQSFAWVGEHLFRSVDGGASFKPVALPLKAAVTALTEDTDGAFFVSLLGTDAKGKPVGGVFVSRDTGQTWTPAGQDAPLAKGAVSVVSTGKNRLLASPAAGGLECSVDAGKTWADRCPKPTP
jgi:RNA polymerase sigma-70 factor (ECF subfamily)